MDQTQPFYPGNRDLPAEVRDRVLTTFRHAVELHKSGRLEEVIAGCDLILKMDPQFSPAKKLLDKVRLPSSTPVPEETHDSSSKPDDLGAAREALKNRDFTRAIDLSNQILRSDLTNEEAQNISSEAQEKIEAGPFAEQFLDKAQNLLRTGSVAGASAELAKVRSLDSDHPRLLSLEAEIAATRNAGESPPSPPPLVASPSSSGAGVQNRPFTPNPDTATQSKPLSFDFQAEPMQTTPDTTSSSFIVDTPAAPSSRTNQASDFGFSFAEDDTSISFEGAAKAPPPTPPAFQHGSMEEQTFDFTNAVVDTTPEDQARIQQYLREGDEAFSEGAYTRATDIWSKIFLIDVTNHPASERIESARKKQLELEAKIEEAMNAGMLAFERNDLQPAKAHFEEVIRLDRGHPTAKDYLNRLADVQSPAPAAAPPSDLEPIEDLEFVDDVFADDTSGIMIPPDPSTLRPTTPGLSASAKTTVAKGPAKRLMPAIVLAGALAILGAAGYFGYRALTGGEDTPDATQSSLLVTRAQALARTGKYDEAIKLLSTIGASDSQHDRAVNLIADYRSKKTSRPALIDGRPADVVFRELLASGQAAFQAKDYLGARESLQKAAAIQPLPQEARGLLDSATAQVSRLEGAISLMKQGNHAAALQNLESLAQQDPGNPNIEKLISNAHFNLGAAAMRSDRLTDAVAEFDKVLQRAPADDEARRSRDIAHKYIEEPKDLLYQIYVKYLPQR